MNDINKLSLRIKLDGTINTRDLGGFETTDHRHIRYKRIIRTDNLSRLTPEDISYFENELQARFDIDLRSNSEICGKNDKKIPFCQYVHCPITDDLNSGKSQHPHEEFIIDHPNIKSLIGFIYTISSDGDITTSMENSYRSFLGLPFGIKHYRLFLDIVRKNKEGSVLYHCADGKDRAGIATVLFLSVLGVDRETIIKDYLKTNAYTQEKADSRVKYLREDCHITNEKVINSVYMLAGVRENWIRAAFDEIDNRFNGMDSYLHNQMELTDEDIEEIKDNYLE